MISYLPIPIRNDARINPVRAHTSLAEISRFLISLTLDIATTQLWYAIVHIPLNSDTSNVKEKNHTRSIRGDSDKLGGLIKKPKETIKTTNDGLSHRACFLSFVLSINFPNIGSVMASVNLININRNPIIEIDSPNSE